MASQVDVASLIRTMKSALEGLEGLEALERERASARSAETAKDTANENLLESQEVPATAPPQTPYVFNKNSPNVSVQPKHDYQTLRSKYFSLQEEFEFVIKDGKYVSPEYMKGVPVAKIVEGNSEYWRQSWPTIQQWIKGSKEPWVMRTVDFWNAYKIHPNQLISIKYIDDLGLCSAETPRILQLVIEDLVYGGVSDPVSWLRERLGHLISEHSRQSDKQFGLKKVLKKFRAHDIEFQKYYRKGKNETGSLINSASLKRAHAGPIEPSARAKKKHSHTRGSDHATVSKTPQKDQVMQPHSPALSEILRRLDSERSSKGARVSGTEVREKWQPEY